MGDKGEEEKEAYLSKALDCLYVALDRIRGDKQNPLNKSLAFEIEQIESSLQQSRAGENLHHT